MARHFGNPTPRVKKETGLKVHRWPAIYAALVVISVGTISFMVGAALSDVRIAIPMPHKDPFVIGIMNLGGLLMAIGVIVFFLIIRREASIASMAIMGAMLHIGVMLPAYSRFVLGWPAPWFYWVMDGILFLFSSFALWAAMHDWFLRRMRSSKPLPVPPPDFRWQDKKRAP